MPDTDTSEVVDAFHRLYYDSGETTWANTRWLGVPVAKVPTDLWIYQELLYELRPGLIVETGTWMGGSAYFLASICDLLGTGNVVSIDIEGNPARPRHPRVTYLQGSSIAPHIVADVQQRAIGVATTMIILDSDHSKEHVLQEMFAYAPLVTPGSYMIVEDTNVNGHPAFPTFGPGPMEALDAFLENRPEFSIDRSREKLLMTFNPRGYLKKSQ